MSSQYLDSPPAYQTVDPCFELPGAHANGHDAQAIQIEREDTPRNRFEHHVQLRQELQFNEWRHMLIDHALFGSVESQKAIAHAWVVAQWRRHGIWDSRWPETGPQTSARWRLDIVPAALLVMEIGSYIEHLVTTQAPTPIPCLSNSNMDGDRVLESAEWPISHLVKTVLTDKSSHWEKAGFASATMGAPSVKFHRDFASLRANLPEPARERLDSHNVRSWSGLSAVPRYQPRPRGGLFGGPMLDPNQHGNGGANRAGSSGSSQDSMTEEAAQRLVQELDDRSSESPRDEETTWAVVREMRQRNRTRRNGERAASQRLPAANRLAAASGSSAGCPRAATSRPAAARTRSATSRQAAARTRSASSRPTAARPQAESSHSTAVRPQGIRKRSSRRKP